MVFPIVAPPDSRGPWFEQTWIYIISESFHVNLSYSGLVVVEKTFKFSHFCDYPPSEEELTLYLNNVESP
jgi:hypothetical protein